MSRKHNTVDEIQKDAVFGNWTVKMEVEKSETGLRMFLCRCACGVERQVQAIGLLSGRSKSCGCLAGEAHGMSKTPEYRAWRSMKDRCYNPNLEAYKDYGGRGIRVCDSWFQSFLSFYRDMGSRPVDHSLERNDVNGDYTPDNCRWATRDEQASNTRKNRWIEYGGETKTITQWGREFNLYPQTIGSRLKRGLSVEQAFGLQDPDSLGGAGV